MKIITEQSELKKEIERLKSQGRTLGLVPTMGALHAGHLSLVKRALDENDALVVSIFVNPTQFNNPDDLVKYPRTLETDVALLQTVSNDILVYAPEVADIYGEDVTAVAYDFDGLEHKMEGQFRPGHFDGVGTIVKRLFEIITPNHAYFGEKDFQQLAIIKKMVDKHNVPVNIVPCEILREENGLAMSSRNVRLKPEYADAAPFIYQTLKTAKEKFGTERANIVIEWVESQFKSHPLLELEYFVIADIETLETIAHKKENTLYRAFVAVYADDIRLIDNIALN
ncbi:pantoate--beta-alanine ligase [Formosa algae]|uniref:Pantothenate synthetase n=1 Tax=Formosa algae TaxID=225843 RepID=A0A9X1CCK2_9FLAO|nr:pantoate--beta-alanine ligase [Formosa algae]MBP1840335.1 pantoate--beta-alanine ligase [Formosa algae]MDQ0334199.1 pantoate--beta-alanine ligase [Formosa algae]OEI82195.1 pantoate--beta-alanine ligase [Formosa algae]